MSEQIIKLKKNQRIEVRIHDFGYGGKGVGKVQTQKGEFIVFVPNTFPGQLVECRLIKLRKQYAEAKLIRCVEKAPEEIDVPYVPTSGAPYIGIPIALQQEFKMQSVRDQFARMGKVQNWEDIYTGFIPSPLSHNYRNKVEYSFSSITQQAGSSEMIDGFALGYKPRGNWRSVTPVTGDTGLFDTEVESQLMSFATWCEQTGIPAWNPVRHTGFYRNLIVRKSFAHNQLLFFLITSDQGLEEFDSKAMYDELIKLFGTRTAGLIHIVNADTGDRMLDRDSNVVAQYGQTYITEQINQVEFKIGIGSFFQTNPQSAEKLYEVVVDYATEGINYSPQDQIMDLFCGTGTISQILRRKVENNIVGVDIVEQAIDDANANAKENGLSNIQYYSNDVGKFLIHHPEYKGKIKTAIVDPPRSGITPKSLDKIIALKADYLVYISCNPNAMSLEIPKLAEVGYELEKVTLVDQFPHTAHIEAVTRFVKKA